MDLLAAYQAYLEEEKHSSENTLCSYTRDINQYFQWLDSENLSPENAAQADVDR